jgi:hypothetical protein
MSCGKVNRNARLTTPQKENNMQEKDFVSYEYRTKTVKSKDMTKATDMYEAFGWEVTSAAHTAVDNTTLSLKRDRKQKHKQELSRLERQAEEIFGTINNLQRAKTLGASVFSYIFGCIAALLLGGGMSLIMLNQNNFAAFVGGIALGIAGIALCCVNYFIYKKMVEKKTGELLPIIDDNEEKLANILEKGNDLLKADLI